MYELPETAVVEATSALNDPVKVEGLQAKARLLAHLAVHEEHAGGQAPEQIEYYSERLSHLLHDISVDYALACDHRPNGKEDDVWDEVFKIQRLEFEAASDEHAPTVAAKILAANLLATCNSDPEVARDKLQTRMWDLAISQKGQVVVDTAREYQGVFVRVGSDTYSSVEEQVYPLRRILELTDHNNTAHTGDGHPMPELLEASPGRAAWFLSHLTLTGRNELAQQNLATLPRDKQLEIGDHLVVDFHASFSTLEALGLDSLFNRADMINMLMRAQKSPESKLDAQKLPREEQCALFDQIVNYSPEATTEGGTPKPEQQTINFLFIRDILRTDDFTDLTATQLEELVGRGFFEDSGWVRLNAFRDLPEGMMARLVATGLDLSRLAEAASNFTVDDQKALFELLPSKHEAWAIYKYPDQFTFTTKAELVDLARERGWLRHVASFVENFTDGSDKQLILELISENRKCANEIAARTGKLEALDVAWFVDTLTQREEWAALANCLGAGNIDELALLDKVLALGHSTAQSALSYNLNKFNPALLPQILDKLIDGQAYEVLAHNIKLFGTNQRTRIVGVLWQSPEGLNALANCLYALPEIDRFDFAHKLADANLVKALAKNFQELTSEGVDGEWLYGHIKQDANALSQLIRTVEHGDVPGFDIQRIFDSIMALPEGYKQVHTYLGKGFNEPEMKLRYLRACIQARNSYYATSADLDLDPMTIVRECLAASWEEPLLSPFNNILERIDPAQLPDAQTLIRMGASATVLIRSDLFPNVSPSMAHDAYMTLLARGDDSALHSTISQANYPIPDEVANRLLQTPGINLLSTRRENFRRELFTPDFLERYLDAGGEGFADLYEYSGQRMPKVERAFEAFGRDCPGALINAVGEVLDRTPGNLPSHLVQLGITETGNRGVMQLKELNMRLRHQIVYGAGNELIQLAETILTNPLASSIARNLVRFDSSQWGMHGDDAWTSTITPHLLTRDLHHPMPSEFVPSNEYTISTLDAKAFDPNNIPEHVSNRYRALQGSIRQALAFVGASPTSAELYEKGAEILRAEIAQLDATEKQLLSRNAPKALMGVAKRRGEVQELLNLSPRGFSRALRNDFQRFTSIKPLSELARTAIFARAVRKSANARMVAQALDGADLSYDALNTMVDFVDHIVNQEVYRDFFTGEKAEQSRKAFSSLLSIDSLAEQIAKAQSGSASGQTTIQFVPTRGLALELSGHAADACWASKEDSIAMQHPNISAVMFMRNPGRPTERLVGACLLIDAKDEDTGEPLLILRGINPIENYINHVRVGEFTEALFDSAKNIANGRRVAVVLDGIVGGASTNRSTLLNYLEQEVRGKQTSGKPLHLAENDTTFNGYVLDSHHPVYALT